MFNWKFALAFIFLWGFTFFLGEYVHTFWLSFARGLKLTENIESFVIMFPIFLFLFIVIGFTTNDTKEE